MSIFKRIKSVKYYIENLKNQIPYIKNQQKLDKHIAMINEIILLINDVEFMIDQKISSDVVDKLILAHMRLLFKTYGTKEGVDIKMVVRDIDQIIKYPKSLQMEYLTDMFSQIKLDRIMSNIPIKEKPGKWKKFGIVWNKTTIDTDKITDKQIADVCKTIVNKPTKKDYDKLLINLLTEFKQQIIWN